MRFKRQDYFKLKRLGKKWRKPKGMQSKMRKGKCGSGPIVRIGYGTKGKSYPVISNINELEANKGSSVLISSGIGSLKTQMIAKKAKELGVVILNMKKVKKAEKNITMLEKKRKENEEKKKKKPESKEKPEKKPEAKKSSK